MKKEESLHKQVCNYLRLQYPSIHFRTDFSAGCKMTMGQAVKHQSLQSCKGWPDLFIAKRNSLYSGLFLELKAEGTKLHKRNGEYATPHLEEQATVMARLNDEGYRARFAIGFKEAISTIDAYMSIR